MKVIEHLTRATRPLISYEIIPPQRGGTQGEVVAFGDALRPLGGLHAERYRGRQPR